MVDRKAWIPLIAVAIAITCLVLWGIFGTVEIKIQAQGMLMGGGVHDIVPIAQGQVIEIKIHEKQKILAGDIVATIDQPNLLQQLAEAKSKLAQLKTQFQELKSFGAQDIKLQYDFNKQQRQNTIESIEIQSKS